MTQIRNPFEHHHDDHDHGHDHDLGQGPEALAAELDPAQQSLADALRVSFGILKVLMLVLVVLYLLSGIVWGVPAQKVAVRLRFGDIVGQTTQEQLLLPGKIYFAWPYPIEQVVQIPTSPQQLDLNREFWYHIPPEQTAKAEEFTGNIGPLNPEIDGSLLTGDGNVIHARWTVKYAIVQPIAFIRHVASATSDEREILDAAQQLVRATAEKSIIATIAQISADDASKGNIHADQVRMRMQKVLDELGAGLVIGDVLAAKPVFPASVRDAFQAVINAENEKAQAVEKARQEASQTLNDTAGSAYAPLMDLVNKFELARAAGDQAVAKELEGRLDWVFDRFQAPSWAALEGSAGAELWARFKEYDAAQQSADPVASAAAKVKYETALDRNRIPLTQRGLLPVGGKVSQVMNESRSYRTAVVAGIQAEAMAFNPRAIDPQSPTEGLLQQYRKNPTVFLNRRWQDMVDTVLAGDNVEVFYLPPGQTYLELSRDPQFKRKREEMRLKAEQDERIKGLQR